MNKQLPDQGFFTLTEASNQDIIITFSKPVFCRCRYDDNIWVYEYDSDFDGNCFSNTYRSGYGENRQEAYEDLMNDFCYDYLDLVINSDKDALSPDAIKYAEELKAAIERVEVK